MKQKKNHIRYIKWIKLPEEFHLCSSLHQNIEYFCKCKILEDIKYFVLMISILHKDRAWLHTAPVSYITALKHQITLHCIIQMERKKVIIFKALLHVYS